MSYRVSGSTLLTALLLSAPLLVQAQEPASEAIIAKAALCATCHGPNGNSTNSKYPSLAGQKATYLYSQLKDFMQGRRNDPEMSAIAKTITDKAEALDLAVYFSNFPEFKFTPDPQNEFKLDPAKAKAGKVIVEQAICTMCHGEALKGLGDVPRVQGQHPQYVAKQLRDLRDGRRTNDGGSMKAALGPLTDEVIDNVAHFILSQ